MRHFPQVARVVVDASVVIKWQLKDEECTEQALALRTDFMPRHCIKPLAPQLFVYEVVNSVVTAVRRKRIDPELAIEVLERLIAFGVEVKEVEPQKILRFALVHNVAAYDAAYLALAKDEKCELWTGDRRLYDSVKGYLDWVKWIGDYAAR